jgi:hypothetical protein
MPARIAVIGVRRSCETERSTAVFISSLRRSDAVSTTSACKRWRASAATTIDVRAGRICARRRCRPAGGRSSGTTSVPTWTSPSRSPIATVRAAGADPSSIEADGAPIASATRRAVRVSASGSSAPPSSSCAICAARSASRRRSSASLARERARSATAAVDSDTTGATCSSG